MCVYQDKSVCWGVGVFLRNVGNVSVQEILVC